MKIRTINKIYGKLKVKCFEMPNASYTDVIGKILEKGRMMRIKSPADF